MDDPPQDFSVGARVRVRRDRESWAGAPWPAEPTGIIDWHPLTDGAEVWRPTETTFGVRRFYWVVFDEPQLDADGDGPYVDAEVLDIYIERVGGRD